jgi:hypothetical protein
LPSSADTDQVRLLEDSPALGDALQHPRHRAAQQRLPELIVQLRKCSTVEDGYDFQKALLDEVLAVESDRNAFSQAVKRMKDGKAPQAGAPEPQSGMDTSAIQTWQLEHRVCERVARQFRCVGDALAWRVFGFRRQHIIALCQNAPPGIMAGKLGLQAELAAIEEARAQGQFAIHHDLTNCLRIGDITVFSNDDGTATTREIKTNPAHQKTVQRQKLRAAQDALTGGPVPGQDRPTVLYDLDIPFRTHLDVLRTGTERAAKEGIFAARLPGDRVLVVADMFGCIARGWTQDEFAQRMDGKMRARLRGAGLTDDRRWHIHATSMDSVSRDPLRVPFATYPLPSVICARIIGDLTVFTVETSGPILAESLRRAGIDARWVREPRPGDLEPGEVVMEMVTRSSFPVAGEVGRMLHRANVAPEYVHGLQMRRSEIDMYLMQLLDQDIWIEGIRYMLTDPELRGRPWPHYRDEDQVWA